MIEYDQKKRVDIAKLRETAKWMEEHGEKGMGPIDELADELEKTYAYLDAELAVRGALLARRPIGLEFHGSVASNKTTLELLEEWSGPNPVDDGLFTPEQKAELARTMDSVERLTEVCGIHDAEGDPMAAVETFAKELDRLTSAAARNPCAKCRDLTQDVAHDCTVATLVSKAKRYDAVKLAVIAATESGPRGGNERGSYDDAAKHIRAIREALGDP